MPDNMIQSGKKMSKTKEDYWSDKYETLKKTKVFVDNIANKGWTDHI